MAKNNMGRAPGGAKKMGKKNNNNGGRAPGGVAKKTGPMAGKKMGKAPGGVKVGALRGKGIKGMQRAANAQANAAASRPFVPSSQRHTLLLQQPTSAAGSRSWSDFNSTVEAVESFVTSYEAQLRKQVNAAARSRAPLPPLLATRRIH